MEVKVFSIDGKEKKNIELSDAVFGRKVSNGVIYEAIKNELANKRVGTASVKTRGEVRGAKSKPWRQKGTGRARSGRRRSPVWVGGGVTFGPQPRDYSYKMPKKSKRSAMKSILSLKVTARQLTVIEDFRIESGKTKELMTILKNFVKDENTVLILHDDDKMIKRAGRNIPWLKFLSFNRLNAHDLFYGKNVLLLETAVGKLNDFYNGDGKDTKKE